MSAMNDNVFDNGLSWAVSNAANLHICSADPGLTYSSVTTNTLGNKLLTLDAISNGTTDGRKTATPAITDGSVTGTGTASHWAVTNGVDTVIASGPLSASQGVTSGNTFTLDAISLTLRDATAV